MASGPLTRDFKGMRIAWSRNLGRYPVEPIVNQVCDSARRVFGDIGCRVDDGPIIVCRHGLCADHG